MYERILLPTDGSAGSNEAITQGLALASKLGARVSFLYVLESPMALYQTPEGTLRAAADEAYLWLFFEGAGGRLPEELMLGFDIRSGARANGATAR